MANRTSTISKMELLALAIQQHSTVQEFLNQEPIRTDLLTGLIHAKGEGKELILLKELLERKKPISISDMIKDYGISKAAVSNTAKMLNEYLEDIFSNTIEPLKAKWIKICVWRNKSKGGVSIGYYFICFNTKTKEYLDIDATTKLFENLWDDFVRERLRKKLEIEAKNELSRKLEGRNDYQLLSMEIGFLPQKSWQNRLDDPNEFKISKTYNHNRGWESFDINSLIKPENISSYLISVDAGGGKTTFLRHLQVEFIQRTGLIPIFLNASKIEEWKPKDSRQFAEKLADSFDLNISKTRVIDFLIKALEKEIVLLVDGLDQIKAGGSEYERVAHHIAELMKKNVIVTSRPSAVINLEDENTFTFLRLKPFGINAQKIYFGNNYERAKQLSQNAADMIAIPMLAHMVRVLIEEKQDEGINNRTQLYHRFTGYILKKYKHGDAKLSADSRTQIKMSLEKIAYEAISEKDPYLQKIPLDFCYDNGRIPTDRKDVLLTSSGLVNLIIEHSGCKDKDCLFFTHQSFQEYFAAEYAEKDENQIQRILSEKWNPKWKEVIKFLVGIKGQVIIEKILSEKDNPIHSKLFLSAELVPEAADIDLEFKKQISQKIEELFENPLLIKTNGIYYWLYVDEANVVNRLSIRIEDINVNVRIKTIEALKCIGGRIPSTDTEMFVNRLMEIVWNNDEDAKVRYSAINVLGDIENWIDDKVIGELIHKLMAIAMDMGNGCSDRYQAIEALGKLESRIDDKVAGKFIKKLMEIVLGNANDPVVSVGTIIAIGRLESRIDDKVAGEFIKKLMEIAVDRDCESMLRYQAISTLGILKSRIDDKVADEFINRLMKIAVDRDNEYRYRYGAIEALGKLESRINDKVAGEFINKLMEIVCDKDEVSWICHGTIIALGRLESRIDDKVAGEFIKKLMEIIFDKDENITVSRSAINIIGKLYRRIDGKLEKRFVNRLMAIAMDVGNGCSDRYQAIEALGKLESRIDDKVAGEVINKLMEIVFDKDEVLWICHGAIEALGRLESRIMDEVIEKIVARQDKRVYVLLRILYEKGRLEHYTS